MTLTWEAPSDTGGGTITRYELRYVEGSSVPSTKEWIDLGNLKTTSLTGLTNGTEYAFEVRAVNSAGGGHARRHHGNAGGHDHDLPGRLSR